MLVSTPLGVAVLIAAILALVALTIVLSVSAIVTRASDRRDLKRSGARRRGD